MTPTEQRAHIADGDYVWCETCGGEGIIRPDDMPAYQCGMCDGDGILFCGHEVEVV